MLKFIERHPFLSLSLITAALLLPTLGHLPVTIMEARNFISAREMLTHDHWILTTMNGEPRYEKPPLPTWITAVAAMVGGIDNVYALRIPGVLMVALAGIFIFLISVELSLSRLQSFFNGLIAISSFYVAGIIIEAPWDIYTHTFVLGAIWLVLRNRSDVRISHGLVVALLLACSVLSKGPIGLYALFLPFLIAIAVVGKTNRRFWIFIIVSSIVGVALGASWFLYVRWADPETFARIAGTETSNWSSYHVKPFYFYWDFFVQTGLWTVPTLMGLLFPYMKKRIPDSNAYRLTFFWTVFALLLLSVIPEKKNRYLVPVLFPLALNTGFYVWYLVTHLKDIKKKWELIPVYFHFGLLGSVGIVIGLFTVVFFSVDLEGWLLVPILIALIVAGGLVLFQIFRKKSVPYAVLASMGVYALLWPIVLNTLPAFRNLNTHYKPLAELADNETRPVYALGLIQPESLWSYGQVMPRIQLADTGYVWPQPQEFGVVVDDTTLVDSLRNVIPFDVKLEEVYDLNLAAYGTRKHKPRYENHYYIFKRRSR